MNELTRASKWLYMKLTADGTLNTAVAGRIYADIAPPTVAWPFVTYQHQASSDLNSVGANRIWVSTLWLVKAVGQVESYEPLRTIADRIDAALHKASGIVDDGTVLHCTREEPFALVEADQQQAPGLQWRHLGGLYRLEIQI